MSVFPDRRVFELRSVVLAAAAVTYGLVFILRWVTGDPMDALDLLYVVPIALVALELGLLAGVCSALVGSALVMESWLGVHGGVDPVAVATHTVVFVAVGVIAGRFSDRMRDAQRRQRRLLGSGLALAHLVDVADLPRRCVRQGAQLLGSDHVRVRMEPGGTGTRAARVTRTGLVEQAFPIQGRELHYGTLLVGGSRPLREDDRAALSILALQAAVAAENAELLASVRERAVIDDELQDARLQLRVRASQLRDLIARQESERGALAYELHEQAAQVLAAVLWGLAALQRELRTVSASPNLKGRLRRDVGSAMGSLRTLAVSLKPATLALGFRDSASSGSSKAAREKGCSVDLGLEGTDDLDPEARTLVYRAVEEALHAAPTPDSIAVRTRRHGDELSVGIHVAHAIDPEALNILRARVYLLGGEVHADDRCVQAVIPLDHRRGTAQSAPEEPVPVVGRSQAPQGVSPVPRPLGSRAG